MDDVTAGSDVVKYFWLSVTGPLVEVLSCAASVEYVGIPLLLVVDDLLSASEKCNQFQVRLMIVWLQYCSAKDLNTVTFYH